MSAGELAYRPHIDGLRAIAVLSVLAYHALGVGGGFVGVDVFFVISGYLIIGLIDRQMAAGAFSFAGFYERRVRRLFPAFFVVVAASAGASAALLMPHDFAAYGRSLLATTAYVSNVEFWTEADYFDVYSAFKPLLHTWSLAVEEQFYLLAPVLLLVCRRVFAGRLGVALAVVFSASLALAVWQVARSSPAAFYLLPARAWELTLGGLLLVLPKQARGGWMSGVGVAMIAIAVVVFSADTPFPGFAALLPCLGSAAVLQSDGEGLGGALLRQPALVYVGKISYPLYLWHWPIFALARYVVGELSPLQTAAAVACAFALAIATYHVVETPIRTRRWLSRRREVFAALAAGSAVLAAIGAAAVISHGAPGRLPPAAVAADNAIDDRESLSCHERSEEDVAARRLCVIGAPVAPSLIVWGDSEGWASQSAIAEALKRLGMSAYVATRDACMPAVGAVRTGSDSAQCERFERAVEALAIGMHARGVLMVGAWSGLYEMHNVRAGKARGWAATQAALGQTIETLRSAGVTPVLFDPPAGARRAAPRGVAQEIAYGRRLNLAFDEATVLAHPYFKAASAWNVPRVQAWRALCQGVCAVAHNGRPYYFDHHHVARSMAGFEVPAIMEALKPLARR